MAKYKKLNIFIAKFGQKEHFDWIGFTKSSVKISDILTFTEKLISWHIFDSKLLIEGHNRGLALYFVFEHY